METRLVTKAGHTGAEGETEGRDGEKKREMCLNKHKHAERRRGQGKRESERGRNK